MIRLGLRLTVRGGREALVRLLITAGAVAIGVAILLIVLADLNAFRTTSGRPCWECTAGAGGARPGAGAELWNYSNEVYADQTIERLDVAALGRHAPVPPGIAHLPGPGQFYASPALAALLRRVPRAELGARFPGTLAGTIGERALTGPDELVVMVGRTPAQLAALPQTQRVTAIAVHSGKQVWTSFFRDAFVVGAVAFVLPILVLIGTATRLAAARLEQRYAALRLIGSTGGQLAVIAAVDAFVSALLGVLAGIVVFALVRPAVADTAITSARYFSNQVTLTALDYVAVLVVIPVTSAVAAVLSLRRVRISPLGVSRRVAPKPPGVWRLAPLVAGAVLFAVGAAKTSHRAISPLIFVGLLLVMAGLIIAGPYLTERAARLLRALAGGAGSLLAARRLADNPRAAFRSVRGLVLAVFLGTVLAGILPAVNAITDTANAHALRNVLLAEFTYSPVCGADVNCTGGGPGGPLGPGHLTKAELVGLLGLPPQAGTALLARLDAISGARAYPVYSSRQNPNIALMSCASLRAVAALGQCPPGQVTAEVNAQSMYSDNPVFSTRPIVDQAAGVTVAGLRRLYLQSVLVATASPAARERARTVLVPFMAQTQSGSAPRTFGEIVGARLGVADTVERLLYIAVALTLLVAGCSLAVSAGGGLVERKRPFSLLRVSGTPVGVLQRVVLLETVLPLAVATVVAGLVAYGIAVLTVGKLALPDTPIPAPGADYYALMGAGLAGSLAVILLTLPLLRRMTSPASARFE
jgi:FtsX-like permease family protein